MYKGASTLSHGFSLRQKIKKADLKYNIEDIKSAESLFDATPCTARYCTCAILRVQFLKKCRLFSPDFGEIVLFLHLNNDTQSSNI